ncbi:hypothetical protein AFK24_26725 [Pseudomonas syringae]|uniref:Uncharacterized protein n=1 Tax=Pseudomonas syringae TaxID=317 RepID=A0A1C7YWE6_PSESX|nr:hypothetical protein AFK24_26725 [Pseudomonas syringae]
MAISIVLFPLSLLVYGVANFKAVWREHVRMVTLNSKVAAGSATIRDLTSVLADLRERGDQAAGKLAAIADASRIAGITREKSMTRCC